METVYWFKSGGQLRIQCVSADDNLVPRALRRPAAKSDPASADALQATLESDRHGALTWAELSGPHEGRDTN